MKKSELQALIREEVKKTLNEAVKLPKDFRITYIKGKSYTFEYTKFGMEPTVAQAEQIVTLLRKQFAKIIDTVQIVQMKNEAHIYIRDENIAIGLDFTSKLGPDEMDKVAGGINYAD
jgi:DNA-binding ferritin-like protein (Dps family)